MRGGGVTFSYYRTGNPVPVTSSNSTNAASFVDIGAYEFHPGCPGCPGDRVWIRPAGGFFSDHANWTFGAPTAAHNARFDLGMEYSVAFDGDAAANSVTVRGRTLSLASQSPLGSLIVGELAGDVAGLTLLAPGVVTTPPGSQVFIGRDARRGPGERGDFLAAYFVGCS